MSGERPQAVRLYASDHPALTNTVRAKLVKRRVELFETTVLAAQNWADFTERRGLIRGLDEAIALCEQAEKDYRDS